MLLTYNQQQAIKPISQNNQLKYNQIANEVENLELGKLLGVAFLQDLQNNPLTAANISLLDGDSFADCDGNIIEHKGLRFVLAYLNYSQYISSSFIADTFTGFVKKTHEDATFLSEGEVKRLQAREREIAFSEWDIIKQFLTENYTDYPLWNCKKEKKLFTPKIETIRKSEKNYSLNRIKRID